MESTTRSRSRFRFGWNECCGWSRFRFWKGVLANEVDYTNAFLLPL